MSDNAPRWGDRTVEEKRAHAHKIAGRMLTLQQRYGPFIRYRMNPFTGLKLQALFRARGHRKGIFTSPEQFIADVVFRDEAALFDVLLASIIGIARGGEHDYDIWLGSGTYMGWAGSLSVGRFDGDKSCLLGLFRMEGHFNDFSDLLEPPYEIPD
jgi:hypothetical protein